MRKMHVRQKGGRSSHKNVGCISVNFYTRHPRINYLMRVFRPLGQQCQHQRASGHQWCRLAAVHASAPGRRRSGNPYGRYLWTETEKQCHIINTAVKGT